MLSTTLYSSTSCDDVRSDVGRDRSPAALSPPPWAPLPLGPAAPLPPVPDAPALPPPPPLRWSDDRKELVLASSSWMLSSSRRRSVCASDATARGEDWPETPPLSHDRAVGRSARSANGP